MIQRLYEDNVKGKLSDERFGTLSNNYEVEQKGLKEKLPELESYLNTETDKVENLQRFVQKVKNVIEPTELTSDFIHEFIEKITVSAPFYVEGKRHQIIDIYYNGVGIISELIPEDMEENYQEKLKQNKNQHKPKLTVL